MPITPRTTMHCTAAGIRPERGEQPEGERISSDDEPEQNTPDEQRRTSRLGIGLSAGKLALQGMAAKDKVSCRLP